MTMFFPSPVSRETQTCRPECGACCVAPSINSPIPGMPNGKPANVRCVQLGIHNECLLFGQPDRPSFCGGLKPNPEMCGNSRQEALLWLSLMEAATRPDQVSEK